jgi:hypothetical protein
MPEQLIRMPCRFDDTSQADSFERRPVELTPSAPLHLLERITAGCLAAVIAGAIVWLFLLQVSSTGTFLEYVFKFVPAMTDGGPASIFDGNAIGDPRPRLLTTFFTYVNIALRRVLLLHGPIHPAIGIAWLIYPICIILMHRVALRLTVDSRAALVAAILYAASPAMLDLFADYYVPAKALASLMMLLAIYGACLIFPAPDSPGFPRPMLGSAILFSAGLFGLLSDETAVFIYACIPLLFANRLLEKKIAASRKWLFTMSLAGSLLIFVIVGFIAVPAINLALGQAPIDLWTTITRGVYEAMFLMSSKPVGNLIGSISPGSLLETILSAHTVPHRHVQHVWTSGWPLPHFFQWPWTDQLGLYFFTVIVIFLILNIRFDRTRRGLVGRLLLAFLVFVVLESILILRLSPWIVEVNYYAAFSSLFFALIMAVLIAGLGRSRWTWSVWLLTAYLGAVGFANYWETAQRHPSIRSSRLSWTQLREVHQKVTAGDFTKVAKEHPFPSPLFFYAFEHAAALEHTAGRRVDLQPMRDLHDTIFRFVDLGKMQDPSTVTSDVAQYDENMLRSAPGVKTESSLALAARLAGRTIRGVAGDWNFIRHYSRSGEVHERVWRQGVMRLWSRRGLSFELGDKLCVDFPSYPRQCIARVYELGEVTYTFSHNGTLMAAFRWVPADVRLPPDLRD